VNGYPFPLCLCHRSPVIPSEARDLAVNVTRDSSSLRSSE
jgi:hypothetical protein